MRIAALLVGSLVAGAWSLACAGSTDDGTADERDSDGGGGTAADHSADGAPWPDGMAASGGTPAGGSGGGSGGSVAGGTAGTGGGTGGAGGGASGTGGTGGGCSPIECTNFDNCQKESQCIAACPAAPNESCNLKDDDCDGGCDEGAGCRLGVHRSYRASTDSHFYTTSATEAGCCGFVLEFANFFHLYAAATPGVVAFHRCLLANGTHLYTTSSVCEGAAGSYEGVLGYIAPNPVCGSTPLHRLYKASSGDHFYTTSDAEKDAAVASSGYVYEFVAGHVWTGP